MYNRLNVPDQQATFIKIYKMPNQKKNIPDCEFNVILT